MKIALQGKPSCYGWIKPRWTSSVVAAALLLANSAAWSTACRISDFSDKQMADLNPLQQLSFLTEMTRTEYERLRKSAPGDRHFHPLVAASDTVVQARQRAWSELESMGIENFDDLRRIWASDYLSAEQLAELTNCISKRQPGLTIAGRPEGPAQFRLTFAHLTPIGIEQIETRVVASHNLANVEELERFLADLGPQDNYPARSFLLKKKDPTRRAVLVLRAGWETPDFIYIPVYPTDHYVKQ